MARVIREKVLKNENGFYHIYSRAAGHKGAYPLSEPENQKKMLELIQYYATSYQCKVHGFCIMGDHYHLVVKFLKSKKLSRNFLKEKASEFDPRHHLQIDSWTKEQWHLFEKRLFNISEYMRSLNRGFTVWYNLKNNLRGSFWAARFKSTVLKNDQALLECMLYVKLNASLENPSLDHSMASCRRRFLRKNK